MTCYVLTFQSTHAAMAAIRALMAASVGFTTIPVPPAISAGCGMSIRFEADDPEPVLHRVFEAEHDRGMVELYRVMDDDTYRREQIG